MLSPEQKQIVQNLVEAISAFQEGISQERLDAEDMKIMERVVKSLSASKLTLESQFLAPQLKPVEEKVEQLDRFAAATKVLEKLASLQA